MSVRASLVALALGTLLPGCQDWVHARVFEAFEPVAVERRSDLPSHSAQWCGECHPDIYAEWSTSRMGRATTNAVFLADWNAPENARSEVCFKCHAPLDVQQPRRLTGLADAVPPIAEGERNPDFDPVLHREGVTCVVCHVQEGTIVGPAGHGAPASPPVADVHGFAKSTWLGAAEQCGECHQFDGVPFTQVDRPVADVVGEWQRWRAGGGTESCIECHMPEIERPAALDAPSRIGRRHTFVAGDDPEFVAEGIELRVSRGDGLEIELVNRAGHHFPTGEPARAVEMVATFVDEEGKTVAEHRAWLERILELPRVRERSDTTLRPHERRAYGFEVPTAAAQAEVVLRYHRAKNLPHVAASDRPPAVVFARRSVSL